MDGVDLITLQSRIREGLQELFPDGVWVRAEIAQLQVNRGHCYLDLVQLKDGRQCAKARAIIWSFNYSIISAMYAKATGSALACGQQVMLFVKVNYSELYGLSLIVEDINPEFTLGDALLRKQQTIERLVKEGYMDMQKELELCAMPRSLAVISSSDAAGYGDFCRHLLENEHGYSFNVQLFPAVMQGSTCPESVRQALKAVEACASGFDAVLILRGGGAQLDLDWFNDFELCRDIALCPLPVFTAIGHDRDFHVADMAAHRYCKTPTALADEFLSVYRALEAQLDTLRTRIEGNYLYKVSVLSSALEALVSRIAGANPRAVLRRGYTLAMNADGVALHSVAGLGKGDTIRILMQDGEIYSVIDHIKNDR